MSKYLVKILSICAFVVMLPLIILGTALCVTETATYKIRLFVDGNDGEYATCEMLINGEKRENNELSLIKNSDVTISFVSNGYNFESWYEGSNTEYQAANKVFTENDVYTFKLTGDIDLTAKCNVKSYSVIYTGENYDGTPLESETVQYKYGEPLKTLDAGDSGTSFVGWMEGTNATPYTRATFAENGEYTLTAVWSNQKKVVYYAADRTTVIYSTVYNSYSFEKAELLDVNSSAVKDGVTPGYSFAGWKDSNNESLDSLQAYKDNFNFETLNIYLSETLNTYNIKVNFNALSSESKNITYDVVNEFSAYDVERTHYTLAGFKYQNKLYAYNAEAKDYVCDGISLGKVLVDNNTFDVECVAVWQSEYPTLNLEVYASESSDTFGVYGEKEGSDEKVYIEGDNKVLSIEDDVNCDALEQSLFETLLGGYSKFYINNGTSSAPNYVEVNLSSVRIYYTALDYVEYMEYNNDQYPKVATFVDMINSILDEEKNEVDINAGDAIQIKFIFA